MYDIDNSIIVNKLGTIYIPSGNIITINKLGNKINTIKTLPKGKGGSVNFLYAATDKFGNLYAAGTFEGQIDFNNLNNPRTPLPLCPLCPPWLKFFLFLIRVNPRNQRTPLPLCPHSLNPR